MNISQYKKHLISQGANLGQVRRNQSDNIINSTFTSDPTFKKVYILTKDGWKWEDAKYQTHLIPSISKDPVDYYLQFRPKVHYPIGSYVIVPDDTNFEPNLSEDELINPFMQPVKNRTQWWIIVGKTDANSYVRYMILKCDWEFNWVYDHKLMTCWGCSKLASSYTSGVWVDDISAALDDLTSAWLPDTYYTYGDSLESLGLCDTRTITHGQRFFMSNNLYDPKIYEVTKIKDINPQGIIKLSIKQDELNESRDNIILKVCDYYASDGSIKVDAPVVTNPEPEKSSTIHWMYLTETNELRYGNGTDLELLQLGKISYFKANFSDENVEAHWKLELVNPEKYSDDEIKYYIGLMKITVFDSSTIAIKPGKAGSLKGKKFILSVSNIQGEYSSSIDVEVGA